MGSLKVSTVQSYRGKLDSYVVPSIGHVPIQRLPPATSTALSGDGAGAAVGALDPQRPHDRPQGARRRRTQGVVEHNAAGEPARRRRGGEGTQVPLWTPVELSRFLVDIEGRPHAMALRFAALTGARRGEVCGLRWADVDLDRAVAMIRQAVVS